MTFTKLFWTLLVWLRDKRLVFRSWNDTHWFRILMTCCLSSCIMRDWTHWNLLPFLSFGKGAQISWSTFLKAFFVFHSCKEWLSIIDSIVVYWFWFLKSFDWDLLLKEFFIQKLRLYHWLLRSYYWGRKRRVVFKRSTLLDRVKHWNRLGKRTARTLH